MIAEIFDIKSQCEAIEQKSTSRELLKL